MNTIHTKHHEDCECGLCDHQKQDALAASVDSSALLGGSEADQLRDNWKFISEVLEKLQSGLIPDEIEALNMLTDYRDELAKKDPPA